MRKLLGCAVLLIPIVGLASLSGNLGLQIDWRDGSSLEPRVFAALNYRQGETSLGMSVNLPLMDLNWNLILRAGLDQEGLRLSLQAGLGPSGPAYFHKEVYLHPEPLPFLEGELRLNVRLSSYLRSPLQSPSLNLSGYGSLHWSRDEFWAEASIEAGIYPFPPAWGRKSLSLGYRPRPWWITARNYFWDRWDHAFVELGYQEDPVRFVLQGTFVPGGFQRASLSLSLNPEPFRIGMNAGLIPSGPVPLSLSLGYMGELVEISLRVSLAFPLRPRSASLEVRLPF